MPWTKSTIRGLFNCGGLLADWTHRDFEERKDCQHCRDQKFSKTAHLNTNIRPSGYSGYWPSSSSETTGVRKSIVKAVFSNQFPLVYLDARTELRPQAG